MSTITLPNIRVSSDLEIGLKLKDGGVAIDWSTMSNIKVSIYSDKQRSIAGRCDISIDEDDATVLVCRYASTKMQYLGVNRVIVQCSYMGETCMEFRSSNLGEDNKFLLTYNQCGCEYV